MESPDPTPDARRTVTITVGKAELGRLVDAMVVPPGVPEWAMRAGAIRRAFARPNEVKALAPGGELAPNFLIELKLLAIK